MKNRNKRLLTAFALSNCLLFTSCGFTDSKVQELKGSISGVTYSIDTFANNGDLTMQTSGKHISMYSNIVNEYGYDSEGNRITTKVESAVMSISIDGHALDTCGDTCIFYEKGLEPVYDFSIEGVEGDGSGFALVDRSVNKIANLVGKSRIVIIKSQLGNPIYAFEGNDVYWEVSEDLPKTTKISIDGKELYIHRANFQLIDKALLKED